MTTTTQSNEKLKLTTIVVDHTQVEQLRKVSSMLNMSKDALLNAILHHHILKKTNAKNLQSH